MNRAQQILPSGSWTTSTASDHIELDHDARPRRRFRYVAQAGTDFLLDLPRATVLNHGDGLLLDDGRVVQVLAAPEALTEVKAHSAQELVKLAWHIGNRHLPAQLDADRILIRQDHVITDMLIGLGAIVRQLQAPFTPESGAYSGGHSHAQQHEHPFVFAPGSHGH